MKTMHCVISGRVQGVSFRAWTRQQARELGLTGWVRNLPNGQVEVMAQGTEELLGKLLDLLHEGPPLARVDRADREFLDNEKPLSGFVIKGVYSS